MFEDSPNDISSPASEDGATPSASLAGLTSESAGPAVALASRSRSGAKSEALATNGIFGPRGFGSLDSDYLTWCLGSKLRATLDVTGSPEFILKWRRWLIRSGLRISVLRAS